MNPKTGEIALENWLLAQEIKDYCSSVVKKKQQEEYV